MNNWSIRSKILGGGIALFVPLICYFILRSTGHTGHVAVPQHFGIDTVITKNVDGKELADTIYHTIGRTQLLSHLNKTVDLKEDFDRKTLVINFFSISDSSTRSDKLSYHMGRIQKGFKMKKHDSAVQLLSIAIFPEKDSLQSIRTYANEHTLDHDTWTFLRGSNEEIERIAKKEFFMQDFSPNQNGVPADIILIDKYRNIRGYYNGLDSLDIIRCIDDIAILMVEKNKIHEKKR